MKGLRFAVAALLLLLGALLLAGRTSQTAPAPSPELAAAAPPPGVPAAGIIPDASTPGRAAAAPATTIAVLRVGAEVELVSWVTKPIACEAPAGEPGAARWVLE